jgi:hypothetical protein
LIGLQKTVKYALISAILVTLTVAGFWMEANNASAQTVSASLNPQTQFPVGSTVSISSIYGVATLASHLFNATGMPGPLAHSGNQTIRNHNWNQTFGKHRWVPPSGMNGTITHSWNQTFINHNWNGTIPQPPAQYSATVTINGQVVNDTATGGIQWTVQGGSILVNGNTFTITGGKGEMSSMDRLTVLGTATDSNGNTVRWQFQGLAAMYNGTVIVELSGGSFAGVNSAVQRVDLTCIATMS